MLLWTDWVFIVIFLVSILLSLRHGFFRELLSFIALLIAFYVSLTHNHFISIQFNKIFGGEFLSPGYAMAGSFFIIMWFSGKIIKRLVRILKIINLGVLDRLLATVFGFTRGVIVVSLIMSFSLFSIFTKTEAWKSTLITSQLQPISNYITVEILSERVKEFVGMQLEDINKSYEFHKAKNIINNSFGADFKVDPEVLKAGEAAEAAKAAEADKVDSKKEEADTKKPVPRIFQKDQNTPATTRPKTEREVLLEKQKAKSESKPETEAGVETKH